MIKVLFFMLFSCCSLLSAGQVNPDTAWIVNLKEQKVKASRIWENDTVRYRYNQTKYYVTTVLPYALEASQMFQQIQEHLEKNDFGRKGKKQFLNQQEEYIREKFEERIRQLNTTQGVLLIKLIARQSGLNIYHMLADTKGGFSALKFDAWARLNGFKLNQTYQPQEEPILEHIMEGLGYPLPQPLAAM